ncbi:MAG: HDOD domain-containing protein [Planctomycetes bacterium]|nr:HDOD domain-containing protein [Planctomycetota bacterium]
MHTGLLLARQPILDRTLRLRGYELLARDSSGSFPIEQPGHVTTCQVLVEALGEFGLERVVGALPAYINITAEFLTGEVPLPLPPDRVVLELLETIEVTDEILQGAKRLKREGFTLAIDDFTSMRPRYEELLRLVDIVKIDCLGMRTEQLETLVRSLRPYGVRLLAEKLETPESFRECEGLGFEFFQGYFFARPDMLRGRTQAVDRSSLLRLLSKIQDPDTTPEELEVIIAQDPVLSLKLVRFLNSAQVGLRRRIESLREVVVYLGSDAVRNIACVMLLARVDDKPRELMVTAMLRARMCEELSRSRQEAAPQRAFTVGLFSMLDALVDQELKDVIGPLPLHEEIHAALLHRSGKLGTQLDLVLAYERCDFGRLPPSDPTPGAMREAYLSSLGWVMKMEQELATLA